MTDRRPATSDDLAYLDAIEDAELRLLCWGVADGAWGEEEIVSFLADRQAASDYRKHEEILEDLIDSGLIIELPTVPLSYRSRMAESVRLLARLRQLFPQHMQNGRWRGAPRLVSDYRFGARARARPKKDRPVEAVLAAVTAGSGLGDPELSALRRLLDPDGHGSWLWSGFQERSFRSVLEGSHSGRDTATLISAGTGAGKTLAYYVPALARIAGLQKQEPRPHTKLVAVYPRNELLKDQLANLLQICRGLRASGGPVIQVGAFFGPTPYDGTSLDRWPKVDGVHRCPYLDCIVSSCDGALVADKVGRTSTELRCEKCGDRIAPEEFVLTRTGCASSPPDVLLTTTEMVNRQLSSDRFGKAFGVGVPRSRRPSMLLLDEVHTYSGMSGASAGLALRRWRHAVGSPVHVAGLSATIVDGADFLSRLASVDADDVSLVEPHAEELEHLGKEYALALRGDPASGTALLSTTIQAAMLLRRCLEPGAGTSDVYGKKLFAFTDDLDVTNRLLHFLREAEGLRDDGMFDGRRQCGSLATLRNPNGADASQRLEDGQSWELATALGFALEPNDRLRVSRTSSQDSGYDPDADIVVATASLEVGLDDAEVGAVIQHKAPRDDAAFVQRKGRAGRSMRMRPWTAVVLSDYGRDRQAFHRWDRLFDPVLEPATLPMSNRFLLKIHGTFSLLEFLAIELRGQGVNSPVLWSDLSQSPDGGRRSGVQEATANVLEQLLEDEVRQEALRRHLADALHLSLDEVDLLLWAPPRSIIGSVVPTLLRRLRTAWSTLGAGPGTDVMGTPVDTPLPDFLPSALFADLLLPEVRIQAPAFRDVEPEPEHMGVLQGLREFSPGRVTHRFAARHRAGRLWIPPGEGFVELADYVDADPPALLQLHDGSGRVIWNVRRPTRFRPVHPDQEIADSSHTAPRWASAILPKGSGVHVPTAVAVVAGSVPGLVFHLHRFSSGAKVHRATSGSDGTVSTGGVNERVSVHFTDGGAPAALGFALEVDAVFFDIVIPGDLVERSLRDDDLRRSLRRDWFLHLAETDESLAQTDPFSRRWLAELLLAGSVLRAVRDQVNIPEALGSLEPSSFAALVVKALDVVFQSTSTGSGDEGGDDRLVARRQRELRALAEDPQVATAMVHLAQRMFKIESDPEFATWVRRRFATTVASAVCHGMGELHRDVNVDDLVLDLQPDGADRYLAWITETKPGGVGALELALEWLRRDPASFWRSVRGLLRTSDDAEVDHALRRIVDELGQGGSLAGPTQRYRDAVGLADRHRAWDRLLRAAADLGIESTQMVTNALASRLLRPGSTASGDAAVARLLDRWDQLETELDLEVDPRTYAYSQAADPGFDVLFGGAIVDDAAQTRFNSMLSILWPRAADGRRRSLSLYQPFHPLLEPDLLLAASLAGGEGVLHEIGADPAVLRDGLKENGTIRLQVKDTDVGEVLRRDLLRLLVEPTEVGVLEFHPAFTGVAVSSAGAREVAVELGEALL